MRSLSSRQARRLEDCARADARRAGQTQIKRSACLATQPCFFSDFPQEDCEDALIEPSRAHEPCHMVCSAATLRLTSEMQLGSNTAGLLKAGPLMLLTVDDQQGVSGQMRMAW